MANGDSLSKVYTLEQCVNRAMSRLGIVDPDGTEIGNIIYKIIQEINVKQKDLAKNLRERDPNVKTLYEQTASLTFTGGECTFNQVEIANPLIVEPIRLDVYKGGVRLAEVPYLPPASFANIAGNNFYVNSLICSFSGRKVQLFAGQNMDVTLYAFKFIYTREANTLTVRTDLMDLPNTSFDDLIKEIELILQAQPKPEPIKE